MPSGILLTFDDGLIDHYKYVLPILKERWLWGTFFICSWPLENKKKVLNVHKIHYLLGKYNAKDLCYVLDKLLLQTDAKELFEKIKNVWAYKNYSIDNYSLKIKHLNYLNDFYLQDYLLNSLLEHFSESPELIWDKIYMNIDQLKELRNIWNIIGWHSKTHRLLAKLQAHEIKEEVGKSNFELTNQLWLTINSFCYPYGVDDSYNEAIINELIEQKVEYAFCVNPRDIISSDSLYELPRYDCTLFKYWLPRL